jgi:hypothetical protein
MERHSPERVIGCKHSDSVPRTTSIEAFLRTVGTQFKEPTVRQLRDNIKGDPAIGVFVVRDEEDVRTPPQ